MNISQKKQIIEYLKPKTQFWSPASFFYKIVWNYLKIEGFLKTKNLLQEIVKKPKHNILIIAEAKSLLTKFN